MVGKLKLIYFLLIIIIVILLVGCMPIKNIKDTIKKDEIIYPTKEEVAEEKARQDEENIIACIKLLPECDSEI